MKLDFEQICSISMGAVRFAGTCPKGRNGQIVDKIHDYEEGIF